MSDAVEKSIDFLIKQGWVGFVILGLIFALVAIWREWKAAVASNKELQEEISSLQEKRIAESRESVQTVAANTASLNGLAQIINVTLASRRD